MATLFICDQDKKKTFLFLYFNEHDHIFIQLHFHENYIRNACIVEFTYISENSTNNFFVLRNKFKRNNYWEYI